ncbi:hypothetical protein B0H19DRAFT_1086219 [Mycena capillaripes]|nr:hypothetical protein B0H19DRAFT_1086219 [Mycena capillaripes]
MKQRNYATPVQRLANAMASVGPTPIKCHEAAAMAPARCVIKGHWCLLCKKDGLPDKKCFLLGNISSRRTHINRDAEDSSQTTLDNFATKTPPFTSQGLLHRWVIRKKCHDYIAHRSANTRGSPVY